MLTFALCCAAILAAGARARAETVEYCPAQLASPAQVVAPRLIALQLESDGPRSVSGSLFVESAAGWYQADFSDVALAQTSVSGGLKGATYTRHPFRSSMLYVQLPAASAILGVFIVQAQATGDPAYGWNARGMVACDSPPNPAPALAAPFFGEPVVMYALPKPASLVLQAQPIPRPLGYARTCPKPFADADIRSSATMSFDPASIGVLGKFGMYVRVAVSDSGRVDGAWPIASSGYPQLDKAAVELAVRSTYRPAISYCAPVRSYYNFLIFVNDNPR